MRLHRWIVAAASWLVPKAPRAEWRAEWEAELRNRESMQQTWAGAPRANDLIRRSAGAFWDAWWLQTSRWYTLRLFGRHWRLATAAMLSLTVAMAATVIGLAAYNAVLVRLPGVGDPRTLQLIHVRTADDAYGVGIVRGVRGVPRRGSRVLGCHCVSLRDPVQRGDSRWRSSRAGRSHARGRQLLSGPRHRATPRTSRPGGAPADGLSGSVISEKFWHSLGSDPALVGGRIVIG